MIKKIILLVLTTLFFQIAFAQTNVGDTIILYEKEAYDSYYDTILLQHNKRHLIYLHNNPNNSEFDRLSNFKLDSSKQVEFNSSIQYLKEAGIKLNKVSINGLPKEWTQCNIWKGRFYNYKPCDYSYYHYQFLFTDTCAIEYSLTNTSASKINKWKKLNDSTYIIYLDGSDKPPRNLVIHIIDKTNGVAIFQEIFKNKKSEYHLMIACNKMRQLPIIVNDCPNNWEEEFKFDTTNFGKLLGYEKKYLQQLFQLKTQTVLEDTTPKSVAINFVKWYLNNYYNGHPESLSYLDGVYPDSTKPYTINFKKVKNYLTFLRSSNYVSKIFTDSLYSHLKVCDSVLKQHPLFDGEPYGLETDIVFKWMELWEIDNNINYAVIDKISYSANRCFLSLRIKGSMNFEFEFSKQNGKWLIDKLNGDLSRNIYYEK